MPLIDSDFAVTGIAQITLDSATPSAIDEQGDPPRLAFEARVDLELGKQTMGRPTITLVSSVVFDPALSWSQIETRIADRVLEIFGALKDLTRDQVAQGFADARRPTS